MAETTKFQANFKLADGTLVNVYADNGADFEAQLTTLQDTAPLIHSVSQSLTSAGVAPAYPRRGGGAPSAPRPANPAPTQELVEGQSPTCAHGVMQLREGVSSKGPWKGWMCSAPKGASPKCDTIWIR